MSEDRGLIYLIPMPQDGDQKAGAISSPTRRLTYDVYTGKRVEQRELPFVLGVIADFSGHKQAEPNRHFVTVNRDNFAIVLNALRPELRLKVLNRLADDDTKLGCDLEFRSLDDFTPEAIARQLPYLKRLLELRTSLAAVRAQLHNNKKLHALLQELFDSSEKLQQVRDQEGL